MTARATPPSAASQVPTGVAFEAFQSLLRGPGPRDALKYLNALTDYRYTGVFRFENGSASGVFYIDRLNPEVSTVDVIPEQATYCCFVRDEAGSFTTVDALLDERLAGHVARGAIRAYFGIPVLDPEGLLLGTFCHFDELPRDPSQVDLDLLVQVASTLALGGYLPPVQLAA